MPFLPMDSLTLLEFIGFPDKKSCIYSLLLYVPQKVSEHVLIRKQVVRVMLQYGSVWLYKMENIFTKFIYPVQCICNLILFLK